MNAVKGFTPTPTTSNVMVPTSRSPVVAHALEHEPTKRTSPIGSLVVHSQLLDHPGALAVDPLVVRRLRRQRERRRRARLDGPGRTGEQGGFHA